MTSNPQNTSSTVHLLLKASALPGADRRQIRAMALGALGESQRPIDEAYLRIILARSYGKREQHRATALEQYELAYDIATRHNLRGPLIQAGLALANMYNAVGRNTDALRVLADLRDKSLDHVSDTLASLGASATAGVATLMEKAGGGLAGWARSLRNTGLTPPEGKS